MLSQESNWLLKEKHQGVKTEAYLFDVARLEAGEPLAYIIGYIPFLNTTIHLDSKPLIPRPETEYWVEKVIAEIKHLALATIEPIHILDLCAGSGCIGVAIAKAIPTAIIDFIEIEEHHLSTITKNCQQNSISSSRFRVLSGNLFSVANNQILPRYHFIISNPPYIDPALDRTEVSVKNFEPASALYGGVLGMSLIEKIITESPRHLLPKGQLWLEHEPEQVDQICEIAHPYFHIIPQHDQYQILRFSQLMLL